MELPEEWNVSNTFNVTNLFQYFPDEHLYYFSKFENEFPESKAKPDTALNDLVIVPY